MTMDDGVAPSSTGGRRRRVADRRSLCCAVLFGVLLGMIWGIGTMKLSRWRLYQVIPLGETRDRAVLLVDSWGDQSVGCAVRHWESPESTCHFEDAWRSYEISFDSATKRVNRKRFYFKYVSLWRSRGK